MKVLCPVKEHVITPGCILLEDTNLVLAEIPCPVINSRACFWLSVTRCHIVMCWLNSQPLILRLIFYLDIRRMGSDPINWWTEPSLAHSSVILFPVTPECLGTKISLTERWAGKITQRPLALPFRWARSLNSQNRFQGKLTIRANTNVFLLSISFHGATAPIGPDPPHYQCFKIALSHTPLSRIFLGELSDRRNIQGMSGK